MADCHDQRAAVRDEVDSVVGELRCISGSLEEVATAWRRAGQFNPGFPARMQEAVHQLVNTVHALTEVGAGQSANLAASAVAQLAALKSGIVSDEAMTSGIPGVEDSRLWAVIDGALDRADKQLWSLISQLRIEGLPVPEHPAAGAAGPASASGPARAS